MASLYELSEEFKNLEVKFLEIIDEETGEIIPEKEKELEEYTYYLESVLRTKGENVIKFIKNQESLIDSVKNEKDRLSKRQKSLEKQLDRFKNYVAMCMVKLGKPIETPNGKISTTTSTSTLINPAVLKKDPRYYSEVVKTEEKWDKKIIKKLIEGGEFLEGAMLEKKTNVKIS